MTTYPQPKAAAGVSKDTRMSTAKEMLELLPCPFCGASASLKRFVTRESGPAIEITHIECSNDEYCAVTADIQHINEAVAVESWNTRTLPSSDQCVAREAVPRKLTGELACILEDCSPPEHQTPEALAALIVQYQPTWDRIVAALTNPAQPELDKPGLPLRRHEQKK